MRHEHYSMYDKQVVIPVVESYHDCMTLIKSDRFRLTGKKESTLSAIWHCLRPFGSSVLFWLRLSQYRKGWMFPFCRYRYHRVSMKANVLIPTSAKIGYGFYIGHGICITVNKGTVIGNNVNLTQFLNIGTNHNTPAIIGDNVYIGPQVCIVEDVKIGNNSSIGAGAIVTKDIPENATAVGVPAKVLNFNDPGRFVKRRWPMPSLQEDNDPAPQQQKKI